MTNYILLNCDVYACPFTRLRRASGGNPALGGTEGYHSNKIPHYLISVYSTINKNSLHGAIRTLLATLWYPLRRI